MDFQSDEIKIEGNIKKKLIPKLSIQEYLVDLLGGLFPGILFILAFLFSFIPPLLTLTSYFNGGDNSLFSIVESFFISVQDTPSAIWIVLFSLFLLLSYIVGHVFYRRDPKDPDRKGFKRLKRIKEKSIIKMDYKKEKEKEKEKKLVKKINLYAKYRMELIPLFSKNAKIKSKLKSELKKEYGCTTVTDCEFPYPFYKDYLKKRGLTHLIKLAIWSNCKDFQRSKTFINILKIRLKYHLPDKYGTIIRNEAHVRLASSTWYVSRISIILGILGLVITCLSIILQINRISDKNAFDIIGENALALVLPIVIILSSGYLWHNITKFIHYQRLREVFYVLETTFTAFRYENFMDIINPPFQITKE